MLKNHRNQSYLILFIFAGLALSAIIGVIWLVLTFPSFSFNTVQKGKIVPVTAPSAAELTQHYKEALQGIIAEAQSSDSDYGKFLSEIENKLLEIRVPRDMRDRHLEKVLAITRMRPEAEDGNILEQNKREQVISLIQELLP